MKLENKDDGLHLSVLDNGLGMSHRVMAGPLLDFGTSFWKSSLVQKEWPGLRASQFRSIGRFGIGFYSVFMISDDLTVTSRQYEKGLDECRTLKFSKPTGIRPIVVDGKARGFPSSASTRVDLLLKPGLLDENLHRRVASGYAGGTDFLVDFPVLVSALVVGLDVNLSVWVDGCEHAVHDPKKLSSEKILARISFGAKNHQSESLIQRHHSRMRPIVDGNGQLHGFAALSTIPDAGFLGLSARLVGGLANGVNNNRASEYLGVMDYKPASARRDPNKFSASEDQLKNWVNEQIELIEAGGPTDKDRAIAAQFASEFAFDPIDFGRVLVVEAAQTSFYTYAKLAELAKTTSVGLLVSEVIKNRAYTTAQMHRLQGKAVIYPMTNLGLALNAEIKNGNPVQENSIAGCLHRAIIRAGYQPVWDRNPSGVSSENWGTLDYVFVRAVATASSVS